MLDLLIHGGSVVDGSGAPARTADVGIVDGRIAEVGALTSEAKVTIEGDGLVVAPGFIDLHSHYDAQLFWDPTLSPSPLHGVTTAVSGNCGLTLAPAAPDDRDFLTRLLARVEAIPVEALLAGVTYEWESFAELLDVIEAKPLALNIGFMVGHSAIRRAVMGPAASTDKASPAQIEAMRALLGSALAAGGFGRHPSRW
jgi:N-acyl-D-aspartate/D-glutamate deacylase